jgi:hypothetical protein
MLYKIITLQGDLNLKTLDIAYIHLTETGGNWSSSVVHHKQSPIAFTATIQQLTAMTAIEFKKMETTVSVKLSKEISDFIANNELVHKIDFISNFGININNELQIENNAVLAANLPYPIIGSYHDMNQILEGDSQKIEKMHEHFLPESNNSASLQKNETIALLGALRWRETNNILAQVTNATKDHVAGSIWLGIEA